MSNTTMLPSEAAVAGSHTKRPRRGRRGPGRGGFDRSTRSGKVVRYILLLALLVVSAGPLIWELSTSLKNKSEDIFTQTPQFLPQHPTIDNYLEVGRIIPVWNFALNSIIVAIICLAGNLIGATIAGYALARLNFRGKRIVFALFLSTLVLPGEVTIISQFQIVTYMGFNNTLFGVALPGMIGAINVLLMRNAFLALPLEVEEAAIVDGANVFQRFLHIGLPSVKGTMSIIAILTFIGAWDDFLWPLLVLQSPDRLTLTVGLSYLHGSFANDPRVVAAGAMIALIPILIFFIALQRYFFSGIGEGAIKG